MNKFSKENLLSNTQRIESRFFLLLIVFLFYFSFSPLLTSKIHNYYNLLVSGFLSGQLNLPIEAPKELLNLSDPYDPIASHKYVKSHNIVNLSLYKGKLFSYFGVTPALILYLPFRLVTGLELPDTFVIILFTFGTLVWLTLLLGYLHTKYFSNVPEWMVKISICLLAVGNLTILQWPLASYSVAISCNCFFVTAALYIFCKYFNITRPKFEILSLGSLFLGLAAGSRINSILYIILLVFLCLYAFKKNNQSIIRFKFFLSLFIPFGTCIFFLGLYNFLRFESFTEFGCRYILCTINSRLIKLLDFQYILPNLYDYLFRLPDFNLTFPYIHMAPWEGDKRSYEKIVGLIPGMPVVLLLLICPLFYLYCKYFLRNYTLNKKVTFPSFEFSVFFFSFFVIFLSLLVFFWVATRYLADFVNQLILATIIVWFYFYLKLINIISVRLLLNATSIFLSLLTIILWIAFSIYWF